MIHRPDQSLAAAFFDSLIAQQDRHMGNFRWDSATQHLGLFDHGLAFALPGNEFNASCFVEWRWNTGRQALEQWELDALTALVRSHDLHGLTTMLRPDRATRLEERAHQMARLGSILPLKAF
jgi:hypothetical protein